MMILFLSSSVIAVLDNGDLYHRKSRNASEAPLDSRIAIFHVEF